MITGSMWSADEAASANFLRRERIRRMVEVRTESTEDVEDLKVRVSALEERLIPVKKFVSYQEANDYFNINKTSNEKLDLLQACERLDLLEEWLKATHPNYGTNSMGKSCLVSIGAPLAARVLNLLKNLCDADNVCPECGWQCDFRQPRFSHAGDCELAACMTLLEKEA